MKRVIVVSLLLAIGTMRGFAQDTLFWFNNNPYVSPTNVASFIPTDVSQSIGALVQLIRDGGDGLRTAPTAFNSTGIGGDDTLVNTWWAGAGGESTGLFFNADTMANLSIGQTSSIYVRVWDRATSGSPNVPAAFDYGGGMVGAFYFDSTVRLANADPAGGGFFNYAANDLDATAQWSFLAIPEPGTMALAGLGLVAMLLRARRKLS